MIEISSEDIKQINEELEYRKKVLALEIKKDIQEAKAHGDLSENAEYQEARRARGRNASRVIYLEKMLVKHILLTPSTDDSTVGFCSNVKLKFLQEDEIETYHITSTLRQDAAKGYISKLSPLGCAIFGKKVGDVVKIEVENSVSYSVEILEISCGNDAQIPIGKF